MCRLKKTTQFHLHPTCIRYNLSLAKSPTFFGNSKGNINIPIFFSFLSRISLIPRNSFQVSSGWITPSHLNYQKRVVVIRTVKSQKFPSIIHYTPQGDGRALKCSCQTSFKSLTNDLYLFSPKYIYAAPAALTSSFSNLSKKQQLKEEKILGGLN